jgi:hypothetical protein
MVSSGYWLMVLVMVLVVIETYWQAGKMFFSMALTHDFTQHHPLWRATRNLILVGLFT